MGNKNSRDNGVRSLEEALEVLNKHEVRSKLKQLKNTGPEQVEGLKVIRKRTDIQRPDFDAACEFFILKTDLITILESALREGARAQDDESLDIALAVIANLARSKNFSMANYCLFSHIKVCVPFFEALVAVFGKKNLSDATLERLFDCFAYMITDKSEALFQYRDKKLIAGLVAIISSTSDFALSLALKYVLILATHKEVAQHLSTHQQLRNTLVGIWQNSPSDTVKLLLLRYSVYIMDSTVGRVQLLSNDELTSVVLLLLKKCSLGETTDSILVHLRLLSANETAASLLLERAEVITEVIALLSTSEEEVGAHIVAIVVHLTATKSAAILAQNGEFISALIGCTRRFHSLECLRDVSSSVLNMSTHASAQSLMAENVELISWIIETLEGLTIAEVRPVAPFLLWTVSNMSVIDANQVILAGNTQLLNVLISLWTCRDLGLCKTSDEIVIPINNVFLWMAKNAEVAQIWANNEAFILALPEGLASTLSYAAMLTMLEMFDCAISKSTKIAEYLTEHERFLHLLEESYKQYPSEEMRNVIRGIYFLTKMPASFIAGDALRVAVSFASAVGGAM